MAPPPSARDVRLRLPADRREKSTPTGVLLFANVALLYAAAFAGAAVAPSWGWRAVLGAAGGVLMSVLFVVGHDACHGSLTPRGRLNKVLGRLAFLPTLHPFTAWDYSHNTLHHAFTNLRGRDPVYPPFSKAEFDALPPWRRGLERLYRSPLGVGLLYFCQIYLPLELFPGAAHRAKMRTPATFQADRLLVLCFLALQVAAALALARRFAPGSADFPAGALGVVCCAVALPFALWNWLMGFLTFLHHTHPRTRWYANEAEWSFYGGQLQGTVHVKFPRPLELALHNIMEHTAHHVDPKVPLYRLRACQEGLEEAYAGDVIVEAWNLRGFLDTTRRCRLYDYESHRWLDWDGSPTTPAHNPP